MAEEEIPLSERSCEPCRGSVPELSQQQIREWSYQVPKWQIEDEHHLVRIFRFPDFLSALAQVNRVGELAEKFGHHPNITFTWGQVEIRIWTHSSDGLTEADFILAAKIDALEPNS
ncbi:MAG: 4a-hydroxytetrahydrobiopterin dehydratase [Planctomycetota bacterium]